MFFFNFVVIRKKFKGLLANHCIFKNCGKRKKIITFSLQINTLFKDYLTGNVIDKYFKCGVCVAPSTWPKIFDLIKKWGYSTLKFVEELASLCNKEYLSKKGKWTVKEIQRNTKVFIEKTFSLTGHNTSSFFNELLALKGELFEIFTRYFYVF